MARNGDRPTDRFGGKPYSEVYGPQLGVPVATNILEIDLST